MTQKQKVKTSDARRRANQTFAEQKMWDLLRTLDFPGVHFRRQAKIGNFIADFAARKAKLVIEVDGGIHRLTVERDLARQKIIEALGYQVLRFTNEEVINRSGDIALTIRLALQSGVDDTPTP